MYKNTKVTIRLNLAKSSYEMTWASPILNKNHQTATGKHLCNLHALKRFLFFVDSSIFCYDTECIYQKLGHFFDTLRSRCLRTPTLFICLFIYEPLKVG